MRGRHALSNPIEKRVAVSGQDYTSRSPWKGLFRSCVSLHVIHVDRRAGRFVADQAGGALDIADLATHAQVKEIVGGAST